jgi:DNA repair protein RecO (recombination protein O)
VPETTLKFELAALREVGHLPSLDQCVVCGVEVSGAEFSGEKRVHFGLTSGGVLCDDCRPGRRGVVSVTSGVIAALKAASGVSNSLELEPAVRGELRAVMNNYFAHVLGHRLKMSEYLGAE